MPDISDIWTPPKATCHDLEETVAELSEVRLTNNDRDGNECDRLSYFAYGSIGCFCYGLIHHHQSSSNCANRQQSGSQVEQSDRMSAIATNLVDVKEDNSRVSCIRFLKTSPFPLVMVLTESGSFLIHNCLSNENLMHLKKSELISRFVEPLQVQQANNGEHCSKKPRFNVTQQINSCLWPNSKNAFLGISLLREKTNLVFWLKLRGFDGMSTPGSYPQSKPDFIESHHKIELDLPQYSNPICCMESLCLEDQVCLIATAMDDGLIVVVKVNFELGQGSRVIKLARHNDQICSMSLYPSRGNKFPLGLLASASRNGLVLVWDIENEFYFADYQASPDLGSKSSGPRINWFALSFVASKDSKTLELLVSNSDSSLTVLDLPENARSKIRLKDGREKQRKPANEQTLRHHALIFNIAFEPFTQTLMTSSLDGNHIFWSLKDQKSCKSTAGRKDGHSLEAKPLYLLSTMPNTSRTHMMRFSQIKEDLLGVALGRAGVKFYQVSERSNERRFDMSSSYSLLARRIAKASLSPTSISWHPSHEYRLALGTLEGKVLRLDLTPRKATFVEAKHRPILSSKLVNPNQINKIESDQMEENLFDVEYRPVERESGDLDETQLTPDHHLKTDGVYSLCWGPNPTFPQDLSRLAIYAVGSMSKRLYIYDCKKDADNLSNYLDDFLDQSLPEAIGESSEVAWKSSLDLMALGTTTGKVLIVSYLEESHADRSRSRLFRRIAVIQGPLGTSYIQCLTWHPTTCVDDPYYHYIAASANESAAYIFNLKENLLVADVKTQLKIQDGDDNCLYADLTANVVSKPVHVLDAHKKSISDIAWNPHEPYQLATASFDRVCYVWSVEESDQSDARIISKFSARDRLFTVEWSLVDTDLILTSGHDSTIWAWRPSENPCKGEA